MDGTYLDYNASAPLPSELVQEAAALLRRTTGNPSSTHSAGRETRKLIRNATERVASLLGCSLTEHDIFWTSGASEGNSWIFHSLPLGQRVIISAVEHESIVLAAQAYQTLRGGTVEVCSVDSNGVLDLHHLEDLLKTSAALVSVVAANNETGVIQPIEAALALSRSAGALFHSDCVQVLGKMPLNLSALPLDLATFSCHKVGAPKGCGFVIARKNGHNKSQKFLTTSIFGKQQGALRGGTENAWAIAVMGLVVEGLLEHKFSLPSELSQWHREFESELKLLAPGSIIHGEAVERLPNTTYIALSGLDADFVIAGLDLEDVWVSSGSACGSSTAEPSKTLLAMGCSSAVARNSVRFSSGYQTKHTDFIRAITILKNIMRRVSK